MYENNDSIKNQSNVKNFKYKKVRNKNKFKDATKEIQKKKIKVCKNENGVVVLKQLFKVKLKLL